MGWISFSLLLLLKRGENQVQILPGAPLSVHATKTCCLVLLLGGPHFVQAAIFFAYSLISPSSYVEIIS